MVLAEATLTHQWTIERHNEHLISLLYHWKTKCLDLLKGNGLEEFVATPLSHMERPTKLDNNDKRHETIKVGRAVQDQIAQDQAHVPVVDRSAEAEQKWKDDAKTLEKKAIQEATAKRETDAKAAQDVEAKRKVDASVVKRRRTSAS
ncbi:hypothetical protein E8E11_008492 [Didymella keratinophila]|nr:hypothetical protein E8E11_008492 [Didymella keratinophila]